MSDESAKHDQLAYFRYAVIAPLLADEPGQTLRERIEKLSSRQWVLPDGRVRSIGFGTIEKWLYGYLRGGLDALRVSRRRDAGTFRGIDTDVAQSIDDVLKSHPRLRTHAIIAHLRRDNLLGDPPPSHSTLYRYIKASRSGKADSMSGSERRSFEAPYAGYLWQADIMYGPHLPTTLPNGRTRREQTYLIGVMDDHSRLLCHGEFFFRQDLAAWFCCLESAVRKRGIPRKLYCDNGQVFTSDQMKQIAANLGMELLHTRVRDAAAKGKIERLFLRVRQSFLDPTMQLSPPRSLEQLNEAFAIWMEREYNQKNHSAFGDTPIRRFMESSSHLRPLPEDGRRLFRVRLDRTVKKDGTFSLHAVTYETVPGLAGRKVVISYDLRDPQRVYVYWQDECFGRATPLDRNSNCNRRRQRRDGEGGEAHA